MEFHIIWKHGIPSNKLLGLNHTGIHMTEEEITKLQHRIEILENSEDDWRYRYKVEAALYNSSVFKMGKWVAISVATLLVIAMFGGAILGSNQIKSVEERAESAEIKIIAKRTETESAFEKELAKIENTQKNVAKKVESFEKMLMDSEQKIVGEAKSKLENALKRVQKLSVAYSAELETAKVAALSKLDVSDLPELGGVKETIRGLEIRAERLEKKNSLQSLEGLYVVFGYLLWVFLVLIIMGPILGGSAIIYARSRAKK